jgi:hypothetical protein
LIFDEIVNFAGFFMSIFSAGINANPQKQCCEAGAARSRIILVKPEPQQDAAPAPASTAKVPNLMPNLARF